MDRLDRLVLGGVAVALIFLALMRSHPPPGQAPGFEVLSAKEGTFKVDRATGQTWRYQNSNVKLGTNVIAAEGWVAIGDFAGAVEDGAKAIDSGLEPLREEVATKVAPRSK